MNLRSLFGKLFTRRSSTQRPIERRAVLAIEQLESRLTPYSVSGNLWAHPELVSASLHEIGHALGLYHSTTSGTAMYGTYSSAMTGLATDDINGIRNIYSGNAARAKDAYDAAASNDTTGTAKDISSLINGTS